MNILMLNYEFPPIGGGAGKAHLCMLKEYAGRQELRIDVLTSAPKPGFSVERFAENIMIYKVGVHKKNLHYWRKIEVIEWLTKAQLRYRKMLRDTNYDLVHAFFGLPTAYLCYRTADKLPYIISLRGSDVPGYNVRLRLDYKLLGGLLRKIWHGAGTLIANSQGLRELALKFMPDAKIGIIPNGIDTVRFCPTKEKRLEKPIKLLAVCRLISRKRIDLLIEAVVEATKTGVDVKLNIAGEGNLLSSLRTLAMELEVDDRIDFLGRIPFEQMSEVYRSNDIFVMSSAHEGMSNAMLEAMASGLPIITTRCEGVEELIADNGIVIEQPNAKLIADAIKKLTQNKQDYKAMCEAARKQAAAFAWSSTASQYVRCYQEILKSKRTGLPENNICVE